MTQKPRVFISHSWADKARAEKIHLALRDCAEVWMDYRQLRPGDVIQNAIDAALQEMDVVLLLWTPRAASSDGVQAELASCQRLGLRVVPCITEYDPGNQPSPPLPDSLAGVLGQDFRHFGTGLARIATLLMETRNDASGVFEQDPRKRLLQELDGLLDYLSHYHKNKGGDAARTEWVERVCQVFEEYVAQGGEPASLTPLLQAAEMMLVNDPEALGILVGRLQPLLQRGTAPEPDSTAGTAPLRKKNKKNKKKAKATALQQQDALAQLLEQHAPPGMATAWSAAIDVYLQAAPALLNAMHLYSMHTGSAAGCEVVNFLYTYLNNGDDLIPDYHGRYGLLDDSWLINNTAFRLLESGIVPTHLLQADWQTIIQADQIVRAFIPAPALATLEQFLAQILSIIRNELNAYQPGYGQMSGGKSIDERWNDVFNDTIDNIGSGF